MAYWIHWLIERIWHPLWNLIFYNMAVWKKVREKIWELKWSLRTWDLSKTEEVSFVPLEHCQEMSYLISACLTCRPIRSHVVWGGGAFFTSMTKDFYINSPFLKGLFVILSVGASRFAAAYRLLHIFHACWMSRWLHPQEEGAEPG